MCCDGNDTLKIIQMVIPKEICEKLDLSPKQRLHVMEKGGVMTLVPELCSYRSGER
jgi:bifunctional DNA-binding transcriptional regulator/antitoxin component of YhaV-PrlF toxin-antitoxin module